MMKSILQASAFFLLTGIASANWQSITSAEYQGADDGIVGAARFRQGGTGSELYVGVPNLGVGANRVEGNSNWTSGTAQAFTFNYNNPTVSGSLGSTGTLSRAGLAGNATALLMVVRLNANQSVTLANMTLGSTSLSDLTVNGGSTGGEFFYQLDGYSNNTTLGGNLTLNFTNTQTSQERPVVEIGATTTPVPEPRFYTMLAASLAGVYFIRRRRQQA